MKRDPDLIRDLMLALEDEEAAELLRLPALKRHARAAIEHHFRLLLEAGLVTAGYHAPSGRGWCAIRLTWAGHDYIDRVRDPFIWRHTRGAMAKAGAWSLDTMGAIAKAAIMARLEQLGISAA